MDVLLFTVSAAASVYAPAFFSSSRPSHKITYRLLQQQNAETSSALIDSYGSSRAFAKLSAYEGELTIRRDHEDDLKLQAGIDFSKSKGVIDPHFVPEPYQTIDVLGKTPDEVAETILHQVQSSQSSSSGLIIVLVGLSGTGKGTTVNCLRSKLESAGQSVVTWSNGNIFRSVTLLAATWCEQHIADGRLDVSKALTKSNIESFMGMLEFGQFGGQWDTRIRGLGLDHLVSNVQNTVLKSPKVSQNIPTVAEFTQGEVILFAAEAVQRLSAAGKVVLLEGREQTVNYVRSPHRFALTLSDPTLIGKRRAAQRLMAEAVKQCSSDSQVMEALDATLAHMVADIP